MLDTRLTYEECKKKAAESRALAQEADEGHLAVMLKHVAETWERICAELARMRH